MRTCLETATLERIERRFDEMEGITGNNYDITRNYRPAISAH
jgi:hypothetical protein